MLPFNENGDMKTMKVLNFKIKRLCLLRAISLVEKVFIISLNIHDIMSLECDQKNVVSSDLQLCDVSKGEQMRDVILFRLINLSMLIPSFFYSDYLLLFPK
jgi:hypothetical protein